MKKILLFLFILLSFIMTPSIAFAEGDGIKFHSTMCNKFDPEDETNNIVRFKPMTNFYYMGINFTNKMELKGRVFFTQKERRWHKSGFVNFKVLGYSNPETNEFVDLSDMNLYGIAKKYEKIEGMQAAKTGTELTATTIAGFILPGVDILYYFTKGSIKNDNGDTRFKSGVHTAYENSIFWFFMKGKPINLVQGDMITVIMYIDNSADETYNKKNKKKYKKCTKIKD